MENLMSGENQQIYPELLNEAGLLESQTMCDKCSTIPNQYITLVCDHNICVLCLALQYYKTKKGNNYKNPNDTVEMPCELCGKHTELEPGTIDAIECIIEQHLTSEGKEENGCFVLNYVDNNDVESKPLSNNEIDPSLERGFIQSSEASLGDKSDRSLNKAINMPLIKKDKIHKENEYLFVKKPVESHTEKPQEQGNPDGSGIALNDNNYIDSNLGFFFNKKKEKQDPLRTQACELHPSEVITLICFTCEFKGVCLDCLVDGGHINHDIKSFNVASQHLKELGSELAFHLKQVESRISLGIRKVEKSLNYIDNKTREVNEVALASLSDIENALSIKERELKQDLHDSLEERQLPAKNLQKKLNENIEPLRSFLKTTQKIQKNQGISPDSLINLFLEFLQNKEAVEKVLSEVNMGNVLKEEDVNAILEAEHGVPDQGFESYKHSLSNIKKSIEEIKTVEPKKSYHMPLPIQSEVITKSKPIVEAEFKILEESTPKKLTKAGFVSQAELRSEHSSSSNRKNELRKNIASDHIRELEYFFPKDDRLFKTTKSRLGSSSHFIPSSLSNKSLSKTRSSNINFSFRGSLINSVDRSFITNNLFGSPRAKLQNSIQIPKTLELNLSSERLNMVERSFNELKKLKIMNSSYERGDFKKCANYSIKSGKNQEENGYFNQKLLGQKKFFDLKKLTVLGAKFS